MTISSQMQKRTAPIIMNSSSFSPISPNSMSSWLPLLQRLQVVGQLVGLVLRQAEVRHRRARLDARRVQHPLDHVLLAVRQHAGDLRVRPLMGQVGADGAARDALDRVAGYAALLQ